MMKFFVSYETKYGLILVLNSRCVMEIYIVKVNAIKWQTIKYFMFAILLNKYLF